MELRDYPSNNCYICNKHFKHYTRSRFNKEVGLREVDLITSHLRCSKLIKKRDKLLADLVEVEYDIFARISE